MGITSMKVHHFARGGGGGLWGGGGGGASTTDHETTAAALSLGSVCKRLRPLAPKIMTMYDTSFTVRNNTSSNGSSSGSDSRVVTAAFDLKSFIRPESSPIDHKRDSPQVETHPGGTRWNPTQEQIGILETLYRGGMRTPNAQQIEQITTQLGKYGKIEGKNVFYWFQNHKARERQKQKRTNLGLTHSPRSAMVVNCLSSSNPKGEVVGSAYYKRKCRSWSFESFEEEEEEDDKTLELFPLHPEGRLRSIFMRN